MHKPTIIAIKSVKDCIQTCFIIIVLYKATHTFQLLKAHMISCPFYSTCLVSKIHVNQCLYNMGHRSLVPHFTDSSKVVNERKCAWLHCSSECPQTACTQYSACTQQSTTSLLSGGWGEMNPLFWAPPKLCPDAYSLHGVQIDLQTSVEHSSAGIWRWGGGIRMFNYPHFFFLIQKGSVNEQKGRKRPHLYWLSITNEVEDITSQFLILT